MAEQRAAPEAGSLLSLALSYAGRMTSRGAAHLLRLPSTSASTSLRQCPLALQPALPRTLY